MKRLLLWVKKPYNGLILDRRTAPACAAWLACVFSIVCFWSALAIAAGGTDIESIQEHSSLALKLMAGAIGLLFTISAGSLVYIYTSGRNSDRKKFEVLFQKIDNMGIKIDSWNAHVLTINAHKDVDHSHLCPVCRTAKLEIKS